MSSNYREERGFDAEDGGMSSPGPSGGGRGGGGGGRQQGGRRYRRRKVCRFCADKVDLIDFKDVKLLQSFIPERSKIMPRRISGGCAMHQRMLAEAIKRARNIALLPYAAD
ncbi:MAG: 30S ribosomal protein S18 [Pyrinomonadaceae bacterium]